MLHAGLTGSIAVGKSFVLKSFAELGCYTADADAIARAVVAQGTAGLRSIVEAFGREVLDDKGELDRKILARIVFENEPERKRLNAILHPLIINEQKKLQRTWEAIQPRGVSVIEAALIIEAESKNRFDKLIVVHCRPEIHLRRLMERDNLTETEARQRTKAQMPQEDKMSHADYLIDSSEDFAEARRQTEIVFHQLQSLA